jgi:Fe-S oxidoreductase
MAGAFGYEVDHYSISMKIAGQSLLPAIKAAIHGEGGEQTIISASGVSCQAQILDGAGRSATHPVILLNQTLAQE